MRRAKRASALTRGWFDPTLLNELEAAGYVASFEDLEAARPEEVVDRVHPREADGEVIGDLARSLDRWFRVLYPVAYLGVFLTAVFA